MSSEKVWSIQYLDRYENREAVWPLVAEGNSRLRAAICILICMFARPEKHVNLHWKGRESRRAAKRRLDGQRSFRSYT